MNGASGDLDLGDRTAAQAQIEKALAIIEELRSEVQIRGLRSSYLATVQPVYEFYIDLLMSLDQQYPGEGYSAKALEAAERARARSLLEMLVEAQIDIRSGVDCSFWNANVICRSVSTRNLSRH